MWSDWGSVYAGLFYAALLILVAVFTIGFLIGKFL